MATRGAAAADDANVGSDDDLFGEAGARLLAARPLDAGTQARADRRDAAINTETMEEIRGRQADEREARTSQELVVGPSRGPTQAPNAGEPGFSEGIVAAVAEVEAAAPSVLQRGRRGTRAGDAHDVSTDGTTEAVEVQQDDDDDHHHDQLDGGEQRYLHYEAAGDMFCGRMLALQLHGG